MVLTAEVWHICHPFTSGLTRAEADRTEGEEVIEGENFCGEVGGVARGWSPFSFLGCRCYRWFVLGKIIICHANPVRSSGTCSGSSSKGLHEKYCMLRYVLLVTKYVC